MARSAEVARAAVEWAEAEGWNPGLDDDRRFVAVDPKAFLSAERDGEVLATVSCALYGDRYAFIGFYIVRPDLRGGGIGSALFDRGLERAEGRVVGLDGVLAQQDSYERRGFVAAHRNVRWRALGGGKRPDGLVELRRSRSESWSRTTQRSSGRSESGSWRYGWTAHLVMPSPAGGMGASPATASCARAGPAPRWARCSPTTRKWQRRC